MVILTAIDLEQAPERPISVGYDLATAYDDTLVVLSVMTESEYDDRIQSREELPDEFDNQFTPDQAAQSISSEVRSVVNRVVGDEHGDRVETRGGIGDPAPTIVGAADELDPRYVVVGGRKQAPAKQAIFGSVSHEVMRQADQPVVTLVEESD
ncbi:universal stress protein [Natrialbaceae archaeon A-CW3]